MIRKETFNSKNEKFRSETPGRVCKTPRIVLKRLNIPLDSVVIVKGDSVIIPQDSSSNKQQHICNVIDIKAGDDGDLNGAMEFQEMAVSFELTKDISNNDKSVSSNQTQLLEQFDNEETSQLGSELQSESETKYYSIGPKSRRKLLSHPPSNKKIRGLSSKNTLILTTNSKNNLDSETAEKPVEMIPESAGLITADNGLEDNISEDMKGNNVTNENIVDYGVQSNSNVTKTNDSPLPDLSNDVQDNSNMKKTSSTTDKVKPKGYRRKASQKVAEVKEDEDKTLSKNQTDTKVSPSEYTPSRTSQRIKNKKVKFSALKLLAGGDIPTPKKKGTTKLSDVKKTSTPKKSLGKIDHTNIADINANESNLSPIPIEIDSVLHKSVNEKLSGSNDQGKVENSKVPERKVIHIKLQKKNTTKQYKNKSVVKLEQESTGEFNTTINKHVAGVIENGNEENSVERKEVNGKIRLELKETPQKKIINITVSPSKVLKKKQEEQKDSLKEKKEIILGPDIVIRRIKSGKKQEKDKADALVKEKEKSAVPTSDSATELSTENQVNVSNVIQSNIIVKNLIYPEKTTKSGIKPMQEVEVPPQIKKFILETAKNKKPTAGDSDSATSGKDKHKKRKSELSKKANGRKNSNSRQKSRRAHSSDEDYSDREIGYDDSTELDQSDLHITNSTFEEDDRLLDTDEANDNLRKSNKLGDTKKNSREEILGGNVVKVGGKKTAKVMPLRLTKVQTRSEMAKKTFNDKFKGHEIDGDMLNVQKYKSSSSISYPTEGALGAKRNFRNAFEKYFICTEKMYEYNELDSDSSSSGSEETNLLSHFIDLRRRNHDNREAMDEIMNHDQTEEETGNVTETEQINGVNGTDSSRVSELGEIMKGVISDLPKWTCHTIPENSVVCLILLEREENGTFDVKKCIEIDDNYRANVYINKELVNEYCGVYDSYNTIKNLIYQVELL